MALIIRILCRDIDFGQNFQFQLFLPTYIDAYWKITKRLVYKQTNKQYFSSFSFPKVSYYYGCLLMAIWKKNHYCKHCKNSIFCFPLKSWYFRYVILKMAADMANLTPAPPGMAHMAGNEPNFWYFIKKYDVKKSVPQMCKIACALFRKIS